MVADCTVKVDYGYTLSIFIADASDLGRDYGLLRHLYSISSVKVNHEPDLPSVMEECKFS